MTTPKKNNYWKWFFVIVVALALFTAVFMIWWNLKLQLKPEQLEAARKVWDARGAADYVMSYKTRKNDETTMDQYVVKVRAKKPYEVIVNGLPLGERLEYFGMDALFNDIERLMELDAEPGKPRTYTRAIFDEESGAIRHYTRRVMGRNERLEIQVAPLEKN